MQACPQFSSSARASRRSQITYTGSARCTASIGPMWRRAARTARKVARMYGTPIYVRENAKVVAKDPNDDTKLDPKIGRNFSRVSGVQWPFSPKLAVGNSAGNSVFGHSRMPYFIVFPRIVQFPPCQKILVCSGQIGNRLFRRKNSQPVRPKGHHLSNWRRFAARSIRRVSTTPSSCTATRRSDIALARRLSHRATTGLSPRSAILWSAVAER